MEREISDCMKKALHNTLLLISVLYNHTYTHTHIDIESVRQTSRRHREWLQQNRNSYSQ